MYVINTTKLIYNSCNSLLFTLLFIGYKYNIITNSKQTAKHYILKLNIILHALFFGAYRPADSTKSATLRPSNYYLINLINLNQKNTKQPWRQLKTFL